MLNSVIILGTLFIGGYFVYTQIIQPAGGLSAIFKSSTVPPIVAPAASATTNKGIVAAVTPSSTNPQYGGLIFETGSSSHSWRQKSIDLPKNNNITQFSCSITVVRDNGNKVPPNSDQLYLFIYFGPNETPGEGELDIKCLATGQTSFVAVYQGTVRSVFSLPVTVGHTYSRTMILNKKAKTITFILKDTNTNQQQQFVLNAKNLVAPEQVAVGIEYHNKLAKGAFPDRYEVSTPNPTFK